MNSRRFAARAVLAAGLVLGLAASAPPLTSAHPKHDSDVAADAPVALKATLTPAVTRAGRVVRANVKVHMAKGFHIQAHKPNDLYMIPTVLTWAAPARLTVGVTAYPAPVKEKLAFADEPLLVYGETIVLRTPIRVRRGTPPGTYKLTGSLRYQACSGTECRAPAKLPVELTVVVKK